MPSKEFLIKCFKKAMYSLLMVIVLNISALLQENRKRVSLGNVTVRKSSFQDQATRLVNKRKTTNLLGQFNCISIAYSNLHSLLNS